ncbi:hypothetical protein [uncultured Herbaspirillum sp.]|uniref:hypothetical protein n=1 Tax=uncultured Herbaspirillum sp. TaxID=160236 RepID=UPI0026132769|nr:hypothetical protein [uncultured Herbaspirillum sp.]
MQDQKIIGSITFTSGLRAGKTVTGMWGDMSEANRKAMAERAKPSYRAIVEKWHDPESVAEIRNSYDKVFLKIP